MQSILNLEGWQLFWTCVGIGIIGGGLLVALAVLVNLAARIGEKNV